MNIFQRISKLLSANIHHLLDAAEDPEMMVRQLIREMEESIIELRRETVKAIGAQKQLEKRIQLKEAQSRELEEKAALALENQNETLAERIVSKKLQTDDSLQILQKELLTAGELARQMKENLTKLEDQVQTARRKKEELVRRQVNAGAHLRSQVALQKSHDALNMLYGSLTDVDDSVNAIESYKDKILQMEAEAEAAEELLNLEQGEEKELDKLLQKKAVATELDRLKKQLREGKPPSPPDDNPASDEKK